MATSRGKKMNKYAHIFSSEIGGWNLFICGPSVVGALPVGWYASKADAEACAKALGAVPYNY